MPMYGYQCMTCKVIWSEFRSIDERNNTKCVKCGASPKHVIIQPAAPRISHFKQGWYEHIGPKPVFIATPQQLRDECEKTGSKSVALENSVFKTRKYHDKAEEDGRAATGDDNPKAVS